MVEMTVLTCDLEVAKGPLTERKKRLDAVLSRIRSSTILGHKILMVGFTDRYTEAYIPFWLFGQSAIVVKKKKPNMGCTRYEGLQIVVEGIVKDTSIFREDFDAGPTAILSVLDASYVTEPHPQKELPLLKKGKPKK
jgi:hypothetical protein